MGLAGSGFGRILTFADLQRIVAPAGPTPRSRTVVQWAKANRIRFGQDGQGGIWTTVDAVNAALGLLPHMATEQVRAESLI